MWFTIRYVMFQNNYRQEWEFMQKSCVSYYDLYANSDVGLYNVVLLMFLFGPELSVFISFQKAWNTRGLDF